MQSFWFRRLKNELPKIDKHLRLKRLKLGFWRIYWKDHYVHEIFEEMPVQYRDIESYDPRLESQKYYEEYEDHVKMVRTLKNFMEGYWDSINKIKKCVYMLKNNAEFFRRSQNAYKQIFIK